MFIGYQSMTNNMIELNVINPKGGNIIMNLNYVLEEQKKKILRKLSKWGN